MIRSLHIVLVGSYPISPDCIRGGVESSVYGLAQELAKTQKVEVMDMPRIGGADVIESDGNLTIYRYANRGVHNQDATKRIPDIISAIAKLQPDVVHIHGTGVFSMRAYGALCKRGIKMAVTVHGLLAVEKHNALKKHFSIKGLYQYAVQTLTERRMLNQCKSVIVDTEYVAEVLRHYGLRHVPVMHVIPQGINAHYYDLLCSKQSKNILSVGTISKRKGHLLLVEAFEKACQRGLDATLTICGVVAEQGYYEALKKRIEGSSCQDRISLVINAPQAELDKAYGNAHLFALHTEEESQGIVFAEAMATGLPVVSTNVGGVPYVVKNGESGLLSAYGDTDAFAEHLYMLMGDANLWQRMSVCAKEVAKSYCWTDIAEKVIKVYAE